MTNKPFLLGSKILTQNKNVPAALSQVRSIGRSSLAWKKKRRTGHRKIPTSRVLAPLLGIAADSNSRNHASRHMLPRIMAEYLLRGDRPRSPDEGHAGRNRLEFESATFPARAFVGISADLTATGRKHRRFCDFEIQGPITREVIPKIKFIEEIIVVRTKVFLNVVREIQPFFAVDIGIAGGSFPQLAPAFEVGLAKHTFFSHQ